ncbi:MAG: MerR family transcriptional regulator [Actinomycetota bacterium]
MTTEPLRKIGELAETSGVTVRTLHYYEEIDLLVPRERTDAGHRLYGAVEVERLYRICLLKQLGMPLDGVRASLADDGADLGDVMRRHLDELDSRLEAENRLRARLARVVGTVAAGSEPTTEILHIMEDMNMLDTNVNRPIASLVYADVDAAAAYLTEVFGLGPAEVTHDPDGNAVHGAVEVGSGTIWLHPETAEFGLSSPQTAGSATGNMVVIVDDVDAHFRHASAAGAAIRYEPVDQPYGYREYGANDGEGHLWSFMKPLED